ncbi:hypothetical protein [Streptomyces purpureus]|uniref:hypothetical protein n=1 Tax=Streptomyces purpureus TaxID=1951 RepID=UPI00059313A0|nr:hypothetical protein [Streptomyces purpureus]
MRKRMLIRSATVLGAAGLIGLATVTSASAATVGHGDDRAEAWAHGARAYDGERDGNGVYAEVYTQAGGHAYVWDGNGSDGNWGPWTDFPSRVSQFRVCEDNKGCSAWIYWP